MISLVESYEELFSVPYANFIDVKHFLKMKSNSSREINKEKSRYS